MVFSFNKNVAFRVAEKQLENLPKLLCNSWDIHALMSSFFSVRKSWNAVKLRRFSCYSTLQLCLEIDAELLHLFYTQICLCWSLEEPMWDLPKYIIEIFIDIQGGGGSFKLRKPIGEVGCCESRMAEQRYWWINRCFRSPRFLSLSCPDADCLPTNFSFFLSFFLSIYLSTYRYLSIYLPFDLSIYLSIYLSIDLSIDLSIYLSIYRSIDRSIYRSIYLSIFLSFFLSIYLSIFLSFYLSIYLSIYPWIYLSIDLSICLSIYLSIDRSIDLAIYLSICLSIYLSIDRSIDLSIDRSIYLSICLSTASIYCVYLSTCLSVCFFL